MQDNYLRDMKAIVAVKKTYLGNNIDLKNQAK